MSNGLIFKVQLSFGLATSTIYESGENQDRTDPSALGSLPAVHNREANSILLHLSNKLTEAGLPARSYALQTIHGYDERWVVAAHHNIHLGSGDGYIWLPIQLSSPAQYYPSPTLEEDSIPAPEDDPITALEDVHHACHVIKTHYTTKTPSACALHVHIGHETGFSLQTLKNLVSFLWLFEPFLDTLHLRLSPSSLNRYASLRDDSVLACRLRGAKHFVRWGLRAIVHVQSVQELMGMIAPATGMGMGEAGFRLRHDNTNPVNVSVTFSQHLVEGTLDGMAVKAWVYTVVGIVRYCEGRDGSDLLALSALIPDEWGMRFEVYDLLYVVGLGWSADYYFWRFEVGEGDESGDDEIDDDESGDDESVCYEIDDDDDSYEIDWREEGGSWCSTVFDGEKLVVYFTDTY